MPNKAALIDVHAGRARSISYACLFKASGTVAAELRRHGISKGSRVLLTLPMSIEAYVILLGVFRVGAIAVFPDTAQGITHFLRSLKQAPPRVIIGKTETLMLSYLLMSGLGVKKRLNVHDLLPGSGINLPGSSAAPSGKAIAPSGSPGGAGDQIELLSDEAPALITFTSGSTSGSASGSKGIVRTHGFLKTQHKVLSETLPPEDDDVELTTLPVFVLSNLASGITTVIPEVDLKKPASIDAARLSKQIERAGVTRILTSPAILEQLCRHLKEKGVTLPSVRSIITGGGPVFPALLSALKCAFPKASTDIVYGSTEAEPIAHINADDISDDDLEAMKSGNGLIVGSPIDRIKVGIIPETSPSYRRLVRSALSEPASTLTGCAGEIVVAGEHVIKGYLNRQDDSHTKISVAGDIWHRTGDAGYLDEHGRLWLLGRTSAKIEDELGFLYPFQVEVAASEQATGRATCVRVRGRRVLVIEKSEMRSAFTWLKFDELKIVSRIPVDRRHGSKILYNRLINQLTNA